MDWIHCNICFRQPTSKSIRFYLSNCGHIFCDDCHVESKEQCKVCEKKCNLMPLVSPLKPSVAVFFTEPNELQQQHSREMAQVLDFQKGHRQKLHTHLLEQNTKCARTNQQFAELENRHNQQVDEFKQQFSEMQNRHNKQLEELKQELQARLQQIDHLKRAIQSGPPPSISVTPNSAGSGAAAVCSDGHTTFHRPAAPIGISSDFRQVNNCTPVMRRLSICSPPVDGQLVYGRGTTPSQMSGRLPLTPSPLSGYGSTQSSNTSVPRRINQQHNLHSASHLILDRSQHHHSPLCQRFSPFAARGGSVSKFTPTSTRQSSVNSSSGCPSRQDLRSYMASR